MLSAFRDVPPRWDFCIPPSLSDATPTKDRIPGSRLTQTPVVRIVRHVVTIGASTLTLGKQRWCLGILLTCLIIFPQTVVALGRRNSLAHHGHDSQVSPSECGHE